MKTEGSLRTENANLYLLYFHSQMKRDKSLLKSAIKFHIYTTTYDNADERNLNESMALTEDLGTIG